MAANGERVLLIGGGGEVGQGIVTGPTPGVYEVRLDGNGGDIRPLGLEDKGGIRFPVVIDNDDPDRLYAPTGADGLWRSDDAGRTWTQKGDGITYKEIWSLVQHPTTGEIYVGTGPAAMFKSSDRAESWNELRGMRMFASSREWSFPGPPFLAHVKHIAIHPDDPQLIWGAVEEGWLVRSTDGGETWENIKDGTEFDSHTATPMLDDPQRVVATAGTGAFLSKDGGDTFVPSSDGLERRYLAGFAIHPDNPRRIFTTGAEVPPPFWRRPEGASAAFYRSDDQGESWQKVTKGVPEWFHAAPRSVASDPADPDTFFVGMRDGTLWMSDDGADSFRQVLEGLPPVTAITVTYR